MSIPVPPVNVRVSLVLNVSLEPLSAASVKELEIVSNSKVPEPFVFRNCPAEPSAAGKVNVVLDEREFAAFSPIKCVPLFVPSLIFNVPPVVALLPTRSSSIALLLSTRTAELAVSVPSVWSILSLKDLPPRTFTVEPSPMNNLSLPWV